MLKKVLVAFLAVILLTALSLGIMLPASAAESTYDVGYSRVDINPYVVDGDFSSGIMALPLRGTGDVWNRLSTNLVDDNGDGVVDENDGLKLTCVAITDSDGTTILMITVDLIGGTLYSKVSKAICERVDAAIATGELSNVVLTADQIYYAGTHTHNAPDTSVYASGGKTGTNNDGVDLSKVNEDLGIWIDRTIEDAADAAILALKDRAPAAMSKDQLSASKVESDVVAGKTMCMTRHYVNTADGSVGGDNFNSRGDDPQQVTDVDDTMYLLNFRFEDPAKLPVSVVSWHGHPSLNNSDDYENGGRHCMSSDYVSAFRHALEFGVDVTVSQNDNLGYVETWQYGAQQQYRVAFFQSTGGNVNPRGHELVRDGNGEILTYTSGSTTKNVVAYSWIDVSGANAKVNGKLMGRACSYGVVLAEMASEALTDGKNETATQAGPIQYMKTTVNTQRKTDGVTEVSYHAAVAYQEAAALYTPTYAAFTTANSKYSAYKNAKQDYDNAGFLAFLYKSKMENALKEFNAAMETYAPLLEEYAAFFAANSTRPGITVYDEVTGSAPKPSRPALSMPFLYKNEAGETYAIGSKYHASAVIGDWDTKLGLPKTTGASYVARAFMLGEEVAFVSVPGEPFDYYFKQTGVYTAENNKWNILLDDTYGKPFVLGYCNGSSGYFPNYQAYEYSSGIEGRAVGSYEVHTSDFAKGTGEEMIDYLNQMLRSMNAEDQVAYCEQCKQKVTWTPYDGQSAVNTNEHFYLASDYSGSQITFGKTTAITVCLDLNGYTLTGANRALYVYNGSTLSVQDSSSAKTGTVQGCGAEYGAGTGYGGATILVEAGGIFNFYSGTIKAYEKTNRSVVTGGVVRTSGIFNMYGGKILGGTASSFTGQYLKDKTPTKPAGTRTAMGGTIANNGTLNIYGGEICNGNLQKITGEVIGSEETGYAYRQTVEVLEGGDPCIGVASGKSVTISGDAKIGSIYFYGGLGKLKVEGSYTGTVELAYPEGTALENHTVIGTAGADADGTAADVSDATISIRGNSALFAIVRGTELLLTDGTQIRGYCHGCQEDALWNIMKNGDFADYGKTLPAGHYILLENCTGPQLQLNVNTQTEENVYCFDLAGHSYTGASRAFYLYKGATLNIMDSSTGGTVKGKTATARSGGAVFTEPDSELNLYSGTILPSNGVSSGASIYSYGSVNIYGGCVEGGTATNYGGAIAIGKKSGADKGGSLCIYGGTITEGAAQKAGNSVYISGSCSVNLTGDATIAQIRFSGSSSAELLTVDTTEKAFTGSVELLYSATPAPATDVGNYLGAKGITGTITIADSDLKVGVDGAELKTTAQILSIYSADKKLCDYASWEAALSAYTYDAAACNFIQLSADITESVAVPAGAVYLDLNGHSISGAINVASGAALYCMDSSTDDYTVNDGKGYGRLTGSISGDVLAVPENTVSSRESAERTYRAGYLKVTETDGAVSFHRVNLSVNSMSLRAANVGVYYSCGFKGDEIVAGKVLHFGIVLSVAGEPTAENITTQCAYSAFEGFESGVSGNAASTTGTLLRNIMKPGNGDTTNARNAQIDVYGRAYILTEDGYVFGSTVVRNLRQQIEAVDGIWDQLSDKQKEAVLDMYATYKTVMDQWSIPGIKAAAK